MMKAWSAVLLAIVTSLCAHTARAPAQDAAEASFHECDLLAAHPNDAGRVADGVADDDLVPSLATEACQAAVKEKPDEVRFRFQLGRAMFAGGAHAEAAGHLRQAAEAGHALANAFLGDAYQLGRGVAKDAAEARRHYQRALDGGFEAAKEMIEALTFEPSAYLVPMATGIFQGIGVLSDPVDLRKQPALVGYVFSFAIGVNNECRGVIPPPNLMNLLVLRYKGPVTTDVEGAGDFQIYSTAGDYDAATFVRRHGCQGPVADQYFKNLNAYVALHRR